MAVTGKTYVFFSILLIVMIVGVESGKVFLFAPFISKSVTITFVPLLHELANRGHQITVLTPYATKNQNHPNITEIAFENDLEEILDQSSHDQLQGSFNPSAGFHMFQQVFRIIDLGLGDPRMQALLNDPTTKFDVAMVIPFFGDEAGYYIAQRFNASLVLYFTGQVSVSWVDEAMGQPHHTAYMPTAILPFTSEMNFFQRAINTLGNFVFHRIMRNMYILGKDYTILKKYFPNEEIPDLLELEKKASLSMSFGHPLIMDGWRPLSPNHVFLGMMNCKETKKLDPANKIGKFLDDAKEGVIYVSFGSVMRASFMSKEKRQMFLNTFKGLKEKVLWKWETEEMEDKPENVMLSKWLPQQEVLAHPNVKLFVTHGGQSSFQETLCHGKPVVAIPLAADQFANGNECERIGIGANLPFISLTEENLKMTINKVLSDPLYGARAKELGSVLVDQINKPLDRAVWWIEHIMRHPTLYSGRSPVHKLTWYQYYLLDVLAFYFAITFFFGWIIFKIIFYCVCKTKKSVVNAKKTKNGNQGHKASKKNK